MSLKKPKRVSINIAQLYTASKGESGSYVTKRSPSKTLTVYGADRDEVYHKIKAMFEK